MTTLQANTPTAAPERPLPVTVREPRRGFDLLGLARLWTSRDLLRYLTLRDIQVRYKQTLLGALWAILQPLTMMVVATVFFGKLLRVEESVDAPYPVFFYAGMLPWTFFAASVSASSNSLVSNAAMLQKIYFPRLVLPAAALGAPAVDLCVSMLVLFGLMTAFGTGFGMGLLLLPVLFVSVVIAALGVGVPLAALSVTYRDFRYVVPFLVQVWFLLTPVIYPVTVVPEQYRWLLQLNPVGGVIEGFRGVVLGQPIDWLAWATSTAVALALLFAGLAFFSRAERRFADVV